MNSKTTKDGYGYPLGPTLQDDPRRSSISRENNGSADGVLSS